MFACDVSALKCRLLPDPTNLPGVVGQGAVFTLIGLAYYDVAVRVRPLTTIKPEFD